jgi:hypothetical protein
MSITKENTSFEQFQQQLQIKIEEQKKGKVEISNNDYYKLQVLRFIIVAGNGAFNALYGWTLGYNILSCLLLASVMFSGDWALSLLHQITSSTKKAYKYSGIITKLGLIFLSLVAGTSFMLGIKHAQNVQSSRVGQLQEELSINQEKFREFGLTRTAKRVRKIQAELEMEKERVGANFSSVNAFPMYLAKMTGYRYESIALGLNISWIAILLFTGMSLSAQLGMVWCSQKAFAIGKELTSEVEMQEKLERAHLKVIQKRKKTINEASTIVLKNEVSNKSLGKPQQTQQSTKTTKPRSLTRDTETVGKAGTRFEEVAQAVREGEFKPTISNIKRFAKCGTATAQKYRQQLIQ